MLCVDNPNMIVCSGVVNLTFIAIAWKRVSGTILKTILCCSAEGGTVWE